MGSLEKVDIAGKLDRITEYYHPHIAGELNGQHVKLAKLKGPFVWHSHQHEDEMFLVVKGELRDGDITLRAGEFLIVPRGVEHMPVADEEVHLMLFEPAGTLNTGDVRNELTVDDPGRI
ncbi:MAG: cupin protein [Chlorobi bacterium]|nr:cupin protein [Chlorobiota bacterium]